MLRLFWASYVFNLKNLTHSGFFVLLTTFSPVVFATIAFFMFRAGDRPGGLLYVALGAGMMGIWSATLFGSGGAIQWQRWQGTLELMVGAPPPFLAILVPMTLATASIGLYSVVATLLWGRVFFGMPLDLAHPLLFALALPVTIASLGLMGVMLASSFVLYRNASAFSNLLEFPVWLVTGLLVPLTLLPAWAEPISWALAPTWGIEAVRGAALGGEGIATAIALTAGLGVAYVLAGALLLRNFERLARKQATLSLT